MSFLKSSIQFICAFLLSVNTVNAQTDNLHVFSTGAMQVYSGAEIGVFGNYFNEGVVTTENRARLYLMGDSAKNSSSSTSPGTGIFHFYMPRPAPYSSNVTQYFSGGGNTASFPSVYIQNSNHVNLTLSDVKVRDTVNFTAGKFILNVRDFTLGDGDKGVLLNYDQNRYFVTNGNPSDTKGYLIRELTGTSATEYPIGLTISDYTPGQLTNSGTSDNFKMRVFNNVYEDGTSGTNVNIKSVGRTWKLEETTSGGTIATLALQHNNATEGSEFSSNRTRHFISHYVGSAPNSGGDTASNTKWDNMKYSTCGSGTSTGTITTGSAISGATVSTRSGIVSFSLFAKSVFSSTGSPLPVALLKFGANWKGANDVRVDWSIASEKNNKGFAIYRSFDGKNYEFLTFVNSKYTTSHVLQNFEYTDLGVRPHTLANVYYKMIQEDLDGKKTEFPPAVLSISKTVIKEITVKTFPNPTSGCVTLNINVSKPQQLILHLIDATGKTLKMQTFNTGSGNNEFVINELLDLPAGGYIIAIKDFQNATIYRNRIIKIN